MGGKKLRPPKSAGMPRIRVTETDAPLHDGNPVFGLSRMAPDYGVARCEKDDKAAFADKLHQLAQMTWLQIYSAGRHGAGCEKISRESILVETVRRKIPEDATILSLRFSGKKPMIGYREKDILHIVALDPNYDVYSHG